jgi:hypothetical protein
MPHGETHPQSDAPSPQRSNMTRFEQEQIRVERLKAWLTAGSIVASVAAAVLAYSSAQRTQNQHAADAFQLKVAEIVMSSRTPWEAKGKARALAAFFPDRASLATAEEFDPGTHGWGRESRRELLGLLTAHPISPQRREVVLKTWKALFPGDTWVNDLSRVP